MPRRIEQHKVQCCEQRPLCLPLSGRFFHVALQRLRRLEANGSNNCTGNYSIKRPIHSLLAFVLLCLFPLCSMQAAEGSEGSESSLGGCFMSRSSRWTRCRRASPAAGWISWSSPWSFKKLFTHTLRESGADGSGLPS